MFAVSSPCASSRAQSVSFARARSTSRRPASAVVVVRAAEGQAGKPAVAETPVVWSAPKLNPNTPSPIFGGSTGGLLRKAQVRFVRARLDSRREIRRET